MTNKVNLVSALASLYRKDEKEVMSMQVMLKIIAIQYILNFSDVETTRR